MRTFRGYSSITQQVARGWRTFHSLQLSFNRRFKDGLSFGFNDTIPLYDHQSTGARLQHNADGTYSERPDQARSRRAARRRRSPTAHLEGQLRVGSAGCPRQRDRDESDRAAGQRLAAVGRLDRARPAPTTRSASPTRGARPGTGTRTSPDRRTTAARVRDHRRSRQRLQRRHLSAVQRGRVRGAAGRQRRPRVGRRLPARLFQQRHRHDASRGPFVSAADGSSSSALDTFNAFNQSRITGRNTNLSVASPTDGTPANLPFDAAGNLIVSRSLPKNAGFGVANGYQAPRTLQAQIRFSF